MAKREREYTENTIKALIEYGVMSIRDLNALDKKTIQSFRDIPAAARTRLVKDLGLNLVLPMLQLDLNRTSSSNSLNWRDFRPSSWDDSKDFNEWIDDCLWNLEICYPTRTNWKNLINSLLTGEARDKAIEIMGENPTISGQNFAEALRRSMVSNSDATQARIQLKNLKWKNDTDAREHYMEVRRLVRKYRPDAPDAYIIDDCLDTLPDVLRFDILADVNYKSSVDSFLNILRAKAEVYRWRNEKKNGTKEENKAKPATDRKQNSRGNGRHRGPMSCHHYSGLHRIRDCPNQNQEAAQGQNQSNSSSSSSTSERRSYNGNRGGFRGRGRGRGRYNNSRTNSYSSQPPLPGTSNASVPSTPQLLHTNFAPVIQAPQASFQQSQPSVSQGQQNQGQHFVVSNECGWSNTLLTETRGLHWNSLESRDVDTRGQSIECSQIFSIIQDPIPIDQGLQSDIALFTSIAENSQQPIEKVVLQVTSSLNVRRNPIPEVTIRMVDSQEEIRALLDTGSSVSIIPGKLCDRIGLPIMPANIQISGINGSPNAVKPRGLTGMFCQTGPDEEKKFLGLYVLDNFEEPVILGREFLRWSRFNIQSCPDGFIIRRNLGRIRDPVRPEKGLIIMMKKPSREEFLGWAEAFQQASRRLIQASFPRAAQCLRIKVDPLGSQAQNFTADIFKRINPSLTVEEKNLIFNTLTKFPQAFSRSKYDLGCVPHQVCNVKINIGTHLVPRNAPYRYSALRAGQLHQIVTEMENVGIIEQSREAGGAPALLVGKKDGSQRMVVNYKDINSITERRCYPMAHLEDFIASVQGFNYFAILDLAQGYYQIEISPTERHKTVFVTQHGKWQFRRLPMGLADSPSYFQELMDRIFGHLRPGVAQVYFDDILVKGRTIPELNANLVKVFGLLIQNNLKVKWEKCQFGVTQLIYLGHLVDGKTCRPNPEKVKMVQCLDVPKSLNKSRSLLGLFNHYSRYIPNYAQLVAPLYRLTSKARRFKIEKSDVEIIKNIKGILAKDCLLSHYNPACPVRLLVDASITAVAAIMEQQEDGDWRAIPYFGQKLQSYQKNYTTQEKECLAVVLAVLRYKHYLEGREFTVVSDHHALCSLRETSFKMERLNRWATALNGFNFKIVYSKGATHPADCFTRLEEWKHRKIEEIDEEDLFTFFGFTIEEVDEEALFSISRDKSTDLSHMDQDVEMMSARAEAKLLADYHHHHEKDCSILDDKWLKNIVLAASVQVPFDRSEIRAKQCADSYCKSIIDDMKNKLESDFSKKFEISDGILFRKPMKKRANSRIVLPLLFKDTVIEYYHSGNAGLHFGAQKTYSAISSTFWCKELFSWVKSKVESCSKCNKVKVAHNIGRVPGIIPVARSPMERIQADVVGPLPVARTGNRFIITAVDMHTSFAWAVARKQVTSKELVEFFAKIFEEKGVAKYFHSDLGRNFMSKKFQAFLSNQGVKHVKSTPYHPQSQGRVERFNGILGDRLKTMIKEKDRWDEKLSNIISLLNSRIIGPDNASPFYLMHGYEARQPVNNVLQVDPPSHGNLADMREKATSSREANQEKVRAKKASKSSDPKLVPGSVVGLKRGFRAKGQGKLGERYDGRYLVSKVHPNGNVELVNLKDETKSVANVSRCKKIRGRKTANHEAMVEKHVLNQQIEEKPPDTGQQK